MEQPVVLVEGDSFIRWLHSYIRYKTKETCGCHVMFYGTPAATLRRFVLCVRRLPVDVLLRRFYYPVHMTNCFSYYRFLLSCIIGLIVGGALNTHVELELELAFCSVVVVLNNLGQTAGMADTQW